MAILSKGHTFADGDDVTSTKLNNLADNATFVSGSSGTTDDSTLEVNGSGRLQVKDSGITTGKIAASAVTTAKLANSTTTTNGVTFPKLRYMGNLTVIGNVSGSSAAPSEVTILDEDDMASDSATALATQQSIKAYVDTYAPGMQYSGASVYSSSAPTSYTDLDLSATIGANRCFVHMRVVTDVNTYIQFRTNGDTVDIGQDDRQQPGGTTGIPLNPVGDGGYVSLITDTAGVVEWKAGSAGTTTTITLLAYQVLV